MKLHRNQDQKASRIEASWLHPSPRDARWLAEVADEIIVSDRTLHPGRFGYIALDHGSAGLVVGAGTGPVLIECPTDMLVLTADRFSEAARRIKTIGDAWANSLDGHLAAA